MRFIFFISIMIVLNTIATGNNNAFCQPNNSVFFEIQMDEKIKEVPYLIIEDHLIDEPELKFEKDRIIQPYKCKGNIYFFDLQDIDEASYFSMVINSEEGRSYILKDYHYEPGDNVAIKVTEDNKMQEYDIDFSGIGSGKYRCISELQYRLSHLKCHETAVFAPDGVYIDKNSCNLNLGILKDAVEKYRPEISEYSYSLLCADIDAQQGKILVAAFYQQMYNTLMNNDEASYLKAAAAYRLHFRSAIEKEIPGNIKYNSREHAGYLLDKLVTDYLEKYTVINFISIYNAIKKVSPAALSDKVLVHLFLKHSMHMKEDYRMLIDVALKSVKNPVCKRALALLSDYGPASIL